MTPFADSEQQAMLRESIRKYLAKNYDTQMRRKIVESEDGWSRQVWRTLGELGVFAAFFPPEFGGFAEATRDMTVVMEELGRRLVVEPVAESIVMAGTLVMLAGRPEQRTDVLALLIAGETVWAVAHGEPGSHGEIAHVTTSATADGRDFLISGRKSAAVAAPWADRLIISARVSGAASDKDGLALFIVDPAADGVSMTAFRTVDGRRAADVVFDKVRVSPADQLGVPGAALPFIEQAIEHAIVAQCAEAVGICAELNDHTIEFAKTRQQFGQPLSRFQVLQHRLVDMYVAHKEAGAMVDALALGFDSGSNDRSRLVSATKVKVAQVGQKIGEEAVQIHGGMGMTDELVIGHLFKRLLAIGIQHGNAEQHLDRYLAAGG